MYAYREGYRAYEMGDDITDNPYPYGSSHYHDWWEGWYDARKDKEGY